MKTIGPVPIILQSAVHTHRTYELHDFVLGKGHPSGKMNMNIYIHRYTCTYIHTHTHTHMEAAVVVLHKVTVGGRAVINFEHSNKNSQLN